MSEIEQVLRNWLAQAMSPIGDFPEGADRAKWVADNFINWWRAAVHKQLADAEAWAGAILHIHRELGIARRSELEDELTDATDNVIESLAEMRKVLGFDAG